MNHESEKRDNALAAWRQRRQQGEGFVTPTGLHIKVRRVSLMDLAEQGAIPAPLVGLVDQVFDKQDHVLQVKDVADFGKVVNLVVRSVVVDPPLAEEASESHVGLEELPMVDRLAIYNWANRPGALATFRPESG
jgi:hypothetical protein